MSFTISRIIAVFLATAIFALHSSNAAEIDSVIPRRGHLDDSLKAINAIFNQQMKDRDITLFSDNIRPSANKKKFSVYRITL